MNNIDYLFTVAPVNGWNILGSKWAVSSFLEAGKMGKRKDLGNFDNTQKYPKIVVVQFS